MSLQNDGGFDYLIVAVTIFACLVAAIAVSELEPAAHKLLPTHHPVNSARKKLSIKNLCAHEPHGRAVHVRCKV